MRGCRRGLVRWVVHMAAINFHFVGVLCASAGGDASSTLATITGIRRRRQRRVLAAGRHVPLLRLVGIWAYWNDQLGMRLQLADENTGLRRDLTWFPVSCCVPGVGCALTALILDSHLRFDDEISLVSIGDITKTRQACCRSDTRTGTWTQSGNSRSRPHADHILPLVVGLRYMYL